MKHDIEEYHATKEQAEKNGKDYQHYFGYEYVVIPQPNGKWKLMAHTDQNLMG